MMEWLRDHEMVIANPAPRPIPALVPEEDSFAISLSSSKQSRLAGFCVYATGHSESLPEKSAGAHL